MCVIEIPTTSAFAAVRIYYFVSDLLSKGHFQHKDFDSCANVGTMSSFLRPEESNRESGD